MRILLIYIILSLLLIGCSEDSENDNQREKLDSSSKAQRDANDDASSDKETEISKTPSQLDSGKEESGLDRSNGIGDAGDSKTPIDADMDSGKFGAGGTSDTGGTGGDAGTGGNGGTGGDSDDDSGADEQSDADTGVTCDPVEVNPEPVEIEVEVSVEYEEQVILPVAVYIMLDRSLSMEDLNKWGTMVNAIGEFVDDPASDFIEIALQYFSLDTPLCDGSLYDTPAVPMVSLPDNADAIKSSLANTSLKLFTPMEPALIGMTAFCGQFQINNPDQKCIGLFISDGAPTMCSLSSSVLIGIAEDAYNTSEVKTFVVGLAGADFSLLDQIAQVSDSDCTPMDATDGFACDAASDMTPLEALEAVRENITEIQTTIVSRIEIQTQVLECEWNIPDPPSAQSFDRDRLNLQFSPTGEDIDNRIVGRVLSEDDCGSVSRGWYYDNPDDPTKIVACPGFCSTIESLGHEVIKVLFGCTTVTAK